MTILGLHHRWRLDAGILSVRGRRIGVIAYDAEAGLYVGRSDDTAHAISTRASTLVVVADAMADRLGEAARDMHAEAGRVPWNCISPDVRPGEETTR
jgi:hypothetical protein